MKKIFTLLLAVSIVGFASAQSGRFDHGKKEESYAFNGKQSAMQQINHEYDYKIAMVKMDRHLNGWEKSRQIRKLENQRDAELSRMQYRFEKDNQHYSDGRFGKNNAHKW